MNVRILGDPDTPAYAVCAELLLRRGHVITYDNPYIAIAPLLTRILTIGQIKEPELGTLIFHPSPLPYGRGASSIKYAYQRREPVTGATWFWADEGIDSGDICEQEIIKINHNQRPRDFYIEHVIPAMLRTLERVITAIEQGIIRRVPQAHEYSTYDRKQ